MLFLAPIYTLLIRGHSNRAFHSVSVDPCPLQSSLMLCSSQVAFLGTGQQIRQLGLNQRRGPTWHMGVVINITSSFWCQLLQGDVCMPKPAINAALCTGTERIAQLRSSTLGSTNGHSMHDGVCNQNMHGHIACSTTGTAVSFR